MKKKVNEVDLSMDADTLNKVRGKLKPTDKINLVDKPAGTSTTSIPSVTIPNPIAEEGVIEPQDPATIKYLSNVKDSTTGEISKPFSIGNKKYQMVRGTLPSKEVVMGVYCHDDLNEAGENIIHPVDHFEKNIAKPMKENGFDYAAAEREHHDRADFEAAEAKPSVKPVQTEPKPAVKKIEKEDFDYAAAEREHHDRADFEAAETKPKTDTKDSLKLAEYKHFVIDKKTGKVRKFKKAEELAKANMTETETYMNLPQFKKHVDETLFGKKEKKNEVSEDATTMPDKPDVTNAIQQMVTRMKPFMDKINEPIEKIQFLVDLTKMMQLSPANYPMLVSALQKAGKSTFGKQTSIQTSQVGVNENKVITKNDLIKTTSNINVIRTIKFKDIK